MRSHLIWLSVLALITGAFASEYSHIPVPRPPLLTPWSTSTDPIGKQIVFPVGVQCPVGCQRQCTCDGPNADHVTCHTDTSWTHAEWASIRGSEPRFFGDHGQNACNLQMRSRHCHCPSSKFDFTQACQVIHPDGTCSVGVPHQRVCPWWFRGLGPSLLLHSLCKLHIIRPPRVTLYSAREASTASSEPEQWVLKDGITEQQAIAIAHSKGFYAPGDPRGKESASADGIPA